MADTVDRTDPSTAQVVIGDTGLPPSLEGYHLMQRVHAQSSDGRDWQKDLYLLRGEGKWFLADWTTELGNGVWFLDGPMDLSEAYRKAPFLFPPCFRPIEED